MKRPRPRSGSLPNSEQGLKTQRKGRFLVATLLGQCFTAQAASSCCTLPAETRENSQMKRVLCTIAAVAYCAGVACGQQSGGGKGAPPKKTPFIKLEPTPATVAWGH